MAKRRSAIDKEVEALITEADDRKSRRRMTAEERKEKKKWESRQGRATYDLPDAVRETLKKIAGDEEVPISQVAALMLAKGIASYQAGDIDLGDKKTPSDSPRYSWNLDLDEELSNIK
jgi:hypothetical protein